MEENQSTDTKVIREVGIGIPEPYDEKFNQILLSDSLLISQLEDLRERYGKLAKTHLAGKFQRALMNRHNDESRCRLMPIVTPDGKIRVATLNEADVIWVARAMTSVIMPHTKRLPYTRNILFNEPVHLRGKEGSKLYSVDFAKSTDPISVDLSKFVLEEIGKAIGAPFWWSDAIETVIRPFTLDGTDKPVTCGAMMGLGPGWSVLCVLNGFAAHRARCNFRSFQVCGDDLIGLWTQKQIEIYNSTVEHLGLVLNKKKSFISPNYGVFCERFVERTSKQTAVCSPQLRIGEACGSFKVDAKRGLLAIDALQAALHDRTVVPPIRECIRRTIKSSRKGLPHIAGEFRQGGTASGKIDATAVIRYALFGPTQLDKKHSDPTISKAREALRNLPSTSTGIPVETVLSQFRAELELSHRMKSHQRSDIPTIRSTKQVRKSVQARTTEAKGIIDDHHGPLNVIREISRGNVKTYVKANAVNWKTVAQHLRHHRPGQALDVLTRSWRSFVDPQSIDTCLKRYLPTVPEQFMTEFSQAHRVWDSPHTT